MQIPNVLSDRYASPAINDIWSEAGRIVLERKFWIAVLKAQKSVGIEIEDGSIEAYESVVEKVDLESIRQREAVTRHDVKARIEEFSDLAGYEQIHKGLTSRDLTDNVEQYQVLNSLLHLRLKYITLLHGVARRSAEWKEVVIVGRTHHQAAQPVTMGRRMAMFGEEMLQAFHRLETLVESYPLRGLKGAAGTGLDQLTLLDGDRDKLADLQEEVRKYLGFGKELNAVGQVYPRGLDFEVISCLFQLGGGVANMARNVRLMAGAEQMTEGFAKGQVGSSAMPHKMNTRSTERINGFQLILGGYLHMVGGLVGDQWFEGDVSCSVVRRVALPDSIFAFDGMLETALHVVDDMGVYEAVVAKELERYMPFLATTTLLMNAVDRGAGREQAHEAIKEHAVASAVEMREKGTLTKDLSARLAADERIPLAAEDIKGILSKSSDFIGASTDQTERFIKEVDEVGSRYPDAKSIQKGELL